MIWDLNRIKRVWRLSRGGRYSHAELASVPQHIFWQEHSSELSRNICNYRNSVLSLHRRRSTDLRALVKDILASTAMDRSGLSSTIFRVRIWLRLCSTVSNSLTTAGNRRLSTVSSLMLSISGFGELVDGLAISLGWEDKMAEMSRRSRWMRRERSW
jgi:hypothetical protein